MTDRYALVDAAGWLVGAMSGSVAVAIATVAVGITGMLMFGGHVDWRRGLSVVLGCFLIFGPPLLLASVTLDAELTPIMSDEPPSTVSDPVSRGGESSGFDPYAGAAPAVQR